MKHILNSCVQMETQDFPPAWGPQFSSWRLLFPGFLPLHPNCPCPFPGPDALPCRVLTAIVTLPIGLSCSASSSSGVLQISPTNCWVNTISRVLQGPSGHGCQRAHSYTGSRLRAHLLPQTLCSLDTHTCLTLFLSTFKIFGPFPSPHLELSPFSLPCFSLITQRFGFQPALLMA